MNPKTAYDYARQLVDYTASLTEQLAIVDQSIEMMDEELLTEADLEIACIVANMNVIADEVIGRLNIHTGAEDDDLYL